MYPSFSSIGSWVPPIFRSSSKTVRILSIDGGGMKGVIPLEVLKRIEAVTNKKICDIFDYVIGTSTGAIIAAAVGTGMEAESIAQKYIQDGPKIFDTTIWQRLNPADRLMYPQFQTAPLKTAIEGYVGDITLNQLPHNVGIVSTCTTMNGGKAVVFSKEKAKKDASYASIKVVDAVLASTAAPTYFNPYNIQIGDKQHTFIDGGMVANAPEAIGLAQAKRMFPNSHEFVIVSLGTGHSDTAFTYTPGTNMGLLRLAANTNAFVSSMLSAQMFLQEELDLSEEVHKNDHRFRIQIELSSAENQMDNADPIYLAMLMQKVDDWMDNNKSFMEDLYEQLGATKKEIAAYENQRQQQAPVAQIAKVG